MLSTLYYSILCTIKAYFIISTNKIKLTLKDNPKLFVLLSFSLNWNPFDS